MFECFTLTSLVAKIANGVTVSIRATNIAVRHQQTRSFRYSFYLHPGGHLYEALNARGYFDIGVLPLTSCYLIIRCLICIDSCQQIIALENAAFHAPAARNRRLLRGGASD